MNLVVVCDSGILTGGAAKIAISTAVAMKPYASRVAFFAGMGHDPVLAEAGVETFDAQQVRFFEHRSKRDKLRYLTSNPIASARFAETLRTFDSTDTVVHVHSCPDRLSHQLIAVAHDAGFPVVATCHDYSLVCPTGLLYDFRRERICELNPLSLACVTCDCTKHNYKDKGLRVLRTGVQNVWGKLHQKVDRFLFVSEFSMKILEPHLHSSGRGEVLYNPGDVEFGPAVDCAANSAFVWIGRMTAEKDPVLLAQAAKIADVPVVFGGTGPMFEAVKAENPRAELVGWLDPAGVDATLRRGRAMVMTSRWYETAGLVVGEASGRGLPSIVPDTCAAQEFVVAGETGIVFHSRDPESLAVALEALRDSTEATRLGKNAYDRFWQSPPTMDTHIEALRVIYERELSQRRQS